MINRKQSSFVASLLAAAAASVVGSTAHAVVDGTVTGGEYSMTLASQNTPTGFGNNQSELNQAFANYTHGGSLQFGLTGNLENNGNGLVIFIDTKAGGAIANSAGGGFGQFGSVSGAKVDDWGTDTNGSADNVPNPGDGISPTPGGGSVISPNFNPDYAIEMNLFGTTYYTNIIDLSLPNSSDPNKDVYLGSNPEGGTPVTQTYYRDPGAVASGDITHAFNNSNLLGVNGYDFGTPPGPLGDPTTASTGVEYDFDATFLGIEPGHALEVMPFITNGDGGYLSNQFLPGVDGAGNLANAYAGHPLFDVRNRSNATDFLLTIWEPTRTTGGNWNSALDWTGNFSPNGAEHAARLNGTVATTITVDANTAVGSLKLDNPAGYTIDGANTLTFNGGPGSARLMALSGSHSVTAPVGIVTDTRIDTASGTTVSLASVTNGSGKTITKAGAGTLTINTQTNSAGASLSVEAGTVNINSDGGSAAALNQNVYVGNNTAAAQVNFNSSQHLNSFYVNPQGLATVGSTGTGTRVIVAPAMGISGNGKLDLTDNKLLTNNAVGTQTAGVYDGVQGLVQTANNPGGGGLFDGPSGITTTKTDATNGSGLTTIGVTTGALARSLGPTDTDTWAGETITGNSTMVMYTYTGDANLDGLIDGTDYFYIDSNVGSSADGYGNGDFNYDGSIDGTDYFYIDNNITAQGAPFYASGGAELLTGVAAVPEPASLSVIGLAAVSLLGRRRRHA